MAITDYIPEMKRRKDDKLVTQSSARSPEASPEVSRSTPGVPNSADSDVVMEQSSTREDDGKGSEGRTKRMTRRRSAIRQAKAEDTSSEDTKDYATFQKKYDEECLKTSRLQDTVVAKEGEVKRLNGQVDFGKKQIQTLRKQLDEARSRLEHQSTNKNSMTRSPSATTWTLKSVPFASNASPPMQSQRVWRPNFTPRRCNLEISKKKYNADRQMLEVRTKELQGAQEYLHATRTYSGAELIRLVESLNGEMMQAAAIITEALKLEQVDSPRDRSKLEDTALESLRLFMSDDMMALFYALDSDDSEPLIQSALQAAMAYCYIYRQQGISSASGRWRAITKDHTKYASLDELEESMRTRMCALMAMVGERVSLVVKRALQIDKVVGLEMTSEDWEVFVVTAGDTFNGDFMQDVYGIHKAKSAGQWGQGDLAGHAQAKGPFEYSVLGKRTPTVTMRNPFKFVFPMDSTPLDFVQRTSLLLYL
ncbi:hypothetical protein Moror_4293 [Moniliophthora roreri MCA 2997]|uniref:Uncharacterized protein n=1 Tax=Moniliophthora roreri (strain MCA 2997) TaxID=1381753 RepID=V2X9Y6_MONRO|nr:hypothetical protein Moror_4293 [Moniliophthora roreri MCA 2997]